MNMDIKELIAKLKSGGSGSSRTSGGVAAFFEKNPKMKIIIPAIFIVISILVSLVIIVKTGKTKVPELPTSSGNNAGEVEVLPDEVRESEKLDGINDSAVFNEAVLAHPKVTAIIYNSEGYYTAIVETDNAHYTTLSVGQYVAGSDWLVESITADRVVFSYNDQKVEVVYTGS